MNFFLKTKIKTKNRIKFIPFLGKKFIPFLGIKFIPFLGIKKITCEFFAYFVQSFTKIHGSFNWELPFYYAAVVVFLYKHYNIK
jgi:hypothetical protein